MQVHLRLHLNLTFLSNQIQDLYLTRILHLFIARRVALKIGCRRLQMAPTAGSIRIPSMFYASFLFDDLLLVAD